MQNNINFRAKLLYNISKIKAQRVERKMQLFVGLGNPGQQYQMNRHNIGFMAVDLAVYNSFGPWRSKFQGLFCEGRLEKQKVIILKPQLYEFIGTISGRAIRFYKINCDITVFHDELDLTPGKCRFKLSGATPATMA